MQRQIDVTVPPGWTGHTIRWVAQGPLRISTRVLNRLKRQERGILVDGQRQFVTYVLQEGQVLSLLYEDPPETCSVQPVPGPLDIVWEDEDLLVIHKPAHTAVHPSAGNYANTLANYLAAHYAALGQTFVPHIITRLDKNTSGLVLLAKHALSAGILNDDIAQGRVHKQYLAITCGILPKTEDLIELPIRRKEGSVLMREVCTSSDVAGRPAQTKYRVLATDSLHGRCLVRVWPLTGRTHQIRVHLAALGCPLVGDFLYGTEEPSLISRHALHMEQLEFLHPITRQPLTLTSPLPPDMAHLASQCR